jgi:hypothetical protein
MFTLFRNIYDYARKTSCRKDPDLPEVTLMFVGLDNAGKTTAIAAALKGTQYEVRDAVK